MAQNTQEPMRYTPMGLYDQSQPRSVAAAEVIATVLSIAWLAAALVFYFTVPSEPLENSSDRLRALVTLLAVCMPIALIWVAALAARSVRIMQEEGDRLQNAIDSMRQAYLAQSQGNGMEGSETVTRKLDEIAAAARKTESALATFASARSATQPRPQKPEPEPQAKADQPTLSLGTPAEEIAAPLSAEDFIRALNFPETAEDEQGFAALRRALKDRTAGQLIQAAQDVLTLMSQDGIYMDDLRPDLARPEVWRHFADGGRGKSVASLGGIRDRSSLALTAGRMKQDPIFRDAAHHFLRKFDQIISDFAAQATDSELAALADTRTARAFMLLGRVAGTFD